MRCDPHDGGQEVRGGSGRGDVFVLQHDPRDVHLRAQILEGKEGNAL